ncbi:MAG: TonB-dependent receptor, partial [Candidatus Eremiobacteraeota bacterium]|nr:TonB-dependent receptor [Candidatus Eremiobacteraeota bacterium]
IGGSVNYRTLEPTRTFHSAVELGIDNYGGTSPSVRITGSTPTHLIDYAFAYALNGTPGPLHNYPVAGSQLPLDYGAAPYFINGRGFAGSPIGLVASKTPQYAGLPGEVYFAPPIYVCCYNLNTQYLNRAELAKLRFNLSQQTALTVSYLGAQSSSDQTGVQASSLTPFGSYMNFSSFAPPPGYTGSVPAGTGIPFDLVANLPLRNSIQQSLFQSELRSALGKTTILARYYAGTDNQYLYDFQQATNESFSGNAWGGAALCGVGVAFSFSTLTCADGAAPTPTYFNGQPTSFTSGDAQLTTLHQDHLRGYSLELDEPIAGNLITLAFDRSHHDSIFTEDAPVDGVVGYQLAPGSGQQFTTILARGQFAVTPRLTTTISNYAIQYTSHYTGDGGVTFQDSTHAFDAPRLSLLWRPNVDVSWRFALGSSIAPPYINLLSAPAQIPQPNSVPATYFNLNTNNGNIKPETAFGYDLGFDKRIMRSMSLSTDVYLTNLHDLFLPSTFQQGTYASAASGGKPLPLFINQTRNLAFARYEGFELALQNAPLAGYGFKLQGALQRGYPYNLPAGFYDTAVGPYTTNLAIISGANFQPSGLGYNGLVGRVPYSTGYGELNFRTLHGLYANLGLTYYGPNNSFNRPAFGVASAAVRVPLAPNASLQFSGDNLTGAYNQAYFGYFDGVPIPLVNGAHGAKTGYVGTTDGGNYGPATLRASLQYKI